MRRDMTRAVCHFRWAISGSVSLEMGSNSGVWSWERVRIEDFDELCSAILRIIRHFSEIL